MMRGWADRLAGAALVAGAVLSAVAVIGLGRARTMPAAFGSPTRPAAGVTGSAPSSALAVPTVRSAPSRPVAARPVSLWIPRLGVRAGVEPVVAVDGILGVPADISRLGWWNGSRPAGAASGSTVLDGHVDSARAGLGALANLSRLRSGDRIVLTTGHGDRLDYRVYARAVYVKAAGLPSGLFTGTGAPRLVLISCGGPFDRASASYRDNIAVFAAPQPATGSARS